MTGDPLGDDARALFAAGARELAPARLRQALLARARADQSSGVVERVPRAAPLQRRARRLWPALSAAAALLSVVAIWRAGPWAPSETPLISAERVPPAAATPVAAPRATPERPASVPEALAPGTGGRAEHGGPRRAPKPAPPPGVPSPDVASTADSLPQRSAAVPDPALPPAPAPPDLGEQLDLLQNVQRALRRGEHRRALELLDTPAGALENGDFAAEARLMRIEALAGAGQPQAAGRLAREFLRLYPHSPLIDRARRFSQSEALEP